MTKPAGPVSVPMKSKCQVVEQYHQCNSIVCWWNAVYTTITNVFTSMWLLHILIDSLVARFLLIFQCSYQDTTKARTYVQHVNTNRSSINTRRVWGHAFQKNLAISEPPSLVFRLFQTLASLSSQTLSRPLENRERVYQMLLVCMNADQSDLTVNSILRQYIATPQLQYVRLIQGCRQLLRSGGGELSLYRVAGSNLRTVRPSSMSEVKLLIICVRKARGKILDPASYLVVRQRSHCNSASNWELPLLYYPTLQGTSSLIIKNK